LDTEPEVPDGQWFKQFSGLTVCGEGELVKTFLQPGQIRSGVFPVVAGVRKRRSDHAAVFTKLGDAGPSDYDIQLVHITSPKYAAHLASAEAGGNKYHTVAGPHGRNFGWY
jgi:hypothetical protein